jgi:type I restriction enzyme S subunit
LVDENRVDGRYLWWYFSREGVWEEALGLSTGGTPTSRNRLKEEKLLAMGIPLPPLEEQRRVVAKIDELAAKIEEAWTLNGDVSRDSNVLLESARLNIFREMAGRHGLRRLDEVSPINMGQSPPGETYNTFGEGVPLLNGPTEFGQRHPVPVQWTSAPTKLCKPGDILLCVRGATTGRLNWADKEYCIGRGLAALTPNPKICLPEYIYHFVETQTQEMLMLAAGSTFPNLPGAKLKVLEIPIPPIPEQHRIVFHLDELQAKVDALKKLQAQTAAELEALMPSILDKGFKGEL